MIGSLLNQSSYNLSHKIQGTNMPANYDVVEAYYAWDTSDPWKVAIKAAPAGTQDLSTINNTIGFWMHITASGRYCSAGYVSDMAIPVKAGWNLVPYPYMARGKTVNTILADLTANAAFGGGLASIQIYSSTAGYKLTTPTGSEPMNPQDALWVRFTPVPAKPLPPPPAIPNRPGSVTTGRWRL